MNDCIKTHPHLTSPSKEREKDKSSNFPSPLRERLGEGVEFARQLRKNQTDAERRIWFLLKDRRFEGLKFRRQHQIGPFTVDFCCIGMKLIVELDGGQHAVRKQLDEKRTEYLKKKGFRVLRFWNHDVLRDSQAVLEVIEKFLWEPSSQPSPFKREKE